MFKNYLKIALAVFLRRKFFTFINMFGITFTLAILMVITAMFDNIFGGVPPETKQQRTLGIYRVSMFHVDEEDNWNSSTSGLAGYGLLNRYLHDLPGVEKVSFTDVFWKVLSFNGDQRIESYLRHTDANYWDILEFDFIEGRPFTQDEYDNAAKVAVINEGTKKKFFGSESAVGKMIEADGIKYRVTGVVKNVPILRIVPFADIWVPITVAPELMDNNQLVGMFMGLILAEKSSDFPAIKEEFASRIKDVDLSYYSPNNRMICVPETKFQNIARLISMEHSGIQTTQFMIKLTLLALLFMILPTVNLVNINISRILERSSEIGVRKSFGASSFSLVFQFLFENILLTLFGGLLALGLAYIILGIIAQSGLIPYANFTLNWRIFLTSLGITFVFGFVSGVYPAWRMSKMRPVEALRGSVR